MNNYRRFALFAVSAVLAAVVSLGVGSSPTATAATDVFAFETSPGLTRTNLIVDHMDFDPVSGLLYVVNDAGGLARLFAFDVNTLEVVDETLVGDGMLQTFDVDVSRDGATVFIATSEGVVSYERSSLSILRNVTLEGGDPERVVGSPDDPNRFIVEVDSMTLISDDGDLINLADLTSPDILIPIPPQGPATWGADSEIVYASDGGDMYRVEVADPPVAVELKFGLRSGSVSFRMPSFQNGRLFYAGKYLDPDTLDIEDELEQDSRNWRSPLADGVGPLVLRTESSSPTVWGLFDESDLTLESSWTLPIESIADDWATFADGRFAVLERAGGGTYLTVGDAGRLASGFGEFTPVQPSRILDTRSGIGRDGAVGKLGTGATIRVQVAGQGGVPDDGVLAVAMNLTVAGPTQSSFFSVWPSGLPRPTVSNLNFRGGQTIANLVTVAVGDDGSVQLSNEFGAAHALLDVVGYYSDEDGPGGARFTSISGAERLVDTRPTVDITATSLRAGETRTIVVESMLPARRDSAGDPYRGEVVAAALNVTAVRPSEAGFFTVWPSGNPRPIASSLNFASGDIRANLVVVALGDDNSVDVFNPFGSVDLLIDVFGVYESFDRPREDQQGRLLPIEPFRRFDSRIDSPFDAPGSLEENRSLIASNARGWTDIWNVTAVQPTSNGFLSVLGYDREFPNTNFPSTSNVNFRAGETVANAVYAPGAPDTEIYNPFGRTHLVIDVFGFLTPDAQRPIEEVWGPAS